MEAHTPENRRRRRAQEWREFRREHLFSQSDLAEALNCSRRTVTGIESGREVIDPRVALLRRFRALKRKCERKQEAAA